ncbi:MAG: AMP-binding protein, partial [Cyanobacteria bacterium P01_C01_bin.73]
HTHLLSTELTARLQTWLRQQRLSLATLIYGAWGILLSRYSGEADVVVGITVSGRSVPLAGIEDMVGLFINTLPLRMTLSARDACGTFLKQIQQTLQDLQAHSYLPLVEIQGLSDVAAGQSLFQTLVVIENFATAQSFDLEQAGLPIEAMAVRERTNYPLMLAVVPGDQLALRFTTDRDRFTAKTLSRLAAHLENLLAAIAADSSRSLATLPLLTDQEQQQHLAWNQTGADYPRSRCLHHLFAEQAARTPEAIAFRCADQQLTYRELEARSNQLAHYLQGLGVKSETLVGLCVVRSLEMAIAVLAILKAGGAYVPLDPSYPQERLAYMLGDSQVSVLLTQSHLTARLPTHGAQVVCLDADWPAQPDYPPAVEVNGENLAYVIYTSGSTGQPKGVQGLHRGAVNRLHWMWQRYPFEAGELCSQKTALSFVDSVWEIFGGLLQGVPTLIIPDQAVKDPYRLIETLSHHRVSRIVLVPSLLSALLETELDLDTQLKALKYWVCSGEVLPASLIEQFYHRFSESMLVNLYGSSEVSADVTYAETARSPLEGPAITAAFEASDIVTDYVAPQSPEETVLVQIWQAAFELEKIGIRDNFFKLGGNQRQGNKIISFIHYLFDIALPLNIFQSAPNIEKLAAVLGDRETESGRTATISKLLKQIQTTSI